MAAELPNQRTRRSAIDTENTFEGQKSRGLTYRRAVAQYSPKKLKSCQFRYFWHHYGSRHPSPRLPSDPRRPQTVAGIEAVLSAASDAAPSKPLTSWSHMSHPKKRRQLPCAVNPHPCTGAESECSNPAQDARGEAKSLKALGGILYFSHGMWGKCGYRKLPDARTRATNAR